MFATNSGYYQKLKPVLVYTQTQFSTKEKKHLSIKHTVKGQAWMRDASKLSTHQLCQHTKTCPYKLRLNPFFKDPHELNDWLQEAGKTKQKINAYKHHLSRLNKPALGMEKNHSSPNTWH